jgi:DeoR/GlpR family transcriptional regulator of sugar metabolism
MTPEALKKAIYNYLYARKRVRPSQLADHYQLSRTRIHQVLKELLNAGKIIKSGKMPKIYYRVVRK